MSWFTLRGFDEDDAANDKEYLQFRADVAAERDGGCTWNGWNEQAKGGDRDFDLSKDDSGHRGRRWN